MSRQLAQPPDHYSRAYASRLHPLHLFHKCRLDRVSSLVPGGTRVLDAGCGDGVLAGLLVRKGCRVVGVDARSAHVDLARRACPAAEFHVADLRELELDERFDVVVCADVLEHLEAAPRQQAIDRLLRHVQPGGLIVVTFPSRLYFAMEPLWRHIRRRLYGYTTWDDDLHLPIGTLLVPRCATIARGTCCLGLVVWTQFRVAG